MDSTQGPPRKPRIAIIGGGPAGLSTAFHLVRDPDWAQRIESITVYQLGWRLGGKGATGRDEYRGFRIEEHGIHGFCSFYFNTWRMMEEVYCTLDPADRARLPTKTIDQAFLGSSTAYTVESLNRQWQDTTSSSPYTAGLPWQDSRTHFGWKEIVRGLLRQLIRRGRRGDANYLGYDDLLPPSGKLSLRRDIAKFHADIVNVDDAIAATPDSTPAPQVDAVLDTQIGRLDAHRPTLDEILANAARGGSASYHRTATTLDFYLATLKGVVKEKFWESTFDLDRLDPVDYREWLHSYGASWLTLASAIAFGVANILFAYDAGDSTKPPTLSTAAWLNWILRSVIGQGEYFYFMAAGTGESVILPLYLWLRRRGVRFELFHKLEAVSSSRATPSSPLVLDRLVFERQAQTVKDPYVPVIEVPSGSKFDAWPNQPRWGDLVNGVQNKALGVNYEAWETRGPNGSKTRTLTRGATTDGFEYVVWAVPPSVTSEVADRLMKKAWNATLTLLRTTATQAVQLWLTRDTAELGWPRDHLEPATARYACATYPNPLNAAVGFDDLIKFEAWPSGGPKGLVYLCSQLQDWPGPQTMAENLTRVRQAAGAAVRVLGNFLQDARASVPARPDPQTIDFDVLFDSKAGRKGEERLDAQYVRANTGPAQMYVQAHPNTVAGRRHAWDSEFSNLVVAGDWIYTGFNLGAFESAVTGGKLAAFALRAFGSPDDLVGFDFLHPKARNAIEAALATHVIPIIP